MAVTKGLMIPLFLGGLKKKAEKICGWRGHKLSEWTEMNSGLKKEKVATRCLVCGDLVIIDRNLKRHEEIYGKAFTHNCKKKVRYG